MFVLGIKKRRRVVGGGLFDWIPKIAGFLGRAGSFISANRGTITNVAKAVGNVAKAGATTASAVRQIVDAVKARRAAAVNEAHLRNENSSAAPVVPAPLEKALSDKSIEYLKQLAVSPPPVVPTMADINSRIAGSGFKTIKPSRCGRGLFLAK